MTSVFRKASLPTLAVLMLVTRLQVVAATNTTSPCSISSNFNGTAVAGGAYIWFSSVFSLPDINPGPLTTPLTIHFTGVTITFTANGTPYTINAPNASFTFDPASNPGRPTGFSAAAYNG